MALPVISAFDKVDRKRAKAHENPEIVASDFERNFVWAAAFLSTLRTRAIGTTVLSWFKPNRQIREDRKHLEARARRLLKGYLSADAPRKQRYYEVIAGAAAACEPGVSDPNLENVQLAQAAAEVALKVVKLVSTEQSLTTIK